MIKDNKIDYDYKPHYSKHKRESTVGNIVVGSSGLGVDIGSGLTMGFNGDIGIKFGDW